MYDIAIIGGGINGCGIARDAAGRGLSVLLAEMDDLASGTSSWSTKLIHGGLRYLEYYQFRLVREALKEREVLWALAPHIIHPARFVLPHHEGLRPAWLLRLGLFLYDNLGGRKRLPGTRVLDLRSDRAGEPLRPEYARGFEYSDCRVDDARLVILNARDAAGRGAVIRTRTRVVSARKDSDRWNITLRDMHSGREWTERARVLVNAAGPWVDGVLRGVLGRKTAHNVRLVKGSHIVVPRLYKHERCYMFQNSDGRVVFAIPFEREFTLVGTTDEDYEGDPGEAVISAGEIDYLCRTVSGYFREPVTPDRVRWSFSGVRPLYDEGVAKAQAASRDYLMSHEGGNGEPGLINVFGGKLTTYRRLAEDAAGAAGAMLGRKTVAWTQGAALPGGDFPVDGLNDLMALLTETYPWLDKEQAARLAGSYGTLAGDVLGKAASGKDLGRDFGAGLSEREADYLVAHEWAQTADDILWRRSKLGLHMPGDGRMRLETWLKARQ